MTSTLPDTLMRGNTRVRNVVGAFLQDKIPSYIDVLRDQNTDINEYELPYPAQYLGTDPFDTDQATYPVVGSYFTSAGNVSNMELLSTGAMQMEITYNVTLFVTVKTPAAGFNPTTGVPLYISPYRDTTIKARDDLMAALRACIINTPSFGTARTRYRMVADYKSMRESYPEPYALNNQHQIWIAAGLMNLDISVVESTANPILGELENIHVGMDQLPFE